MKAEDLAFVTLALTILGHISMVMYLRGRTREDQSAWRDSYNALKQDFVSMQRELTVLRDKLSGQEMLLNAYREDKDRRIIKINQLEVRIHEMELALESRDHRIAELEREHKKLHEELDLLRSQFTDI